MSKQIDYPIGMISHMTEKVDGVPGYNLPTWAARQRKVETLYPGAMAARGYVFILAKDAANLRVGDPLQVDRGHYRITSIGRPESVEDAGRDEPHRKVRACRVRIKFEQYI